jgi:sortase A
MSDASKQPRFLNQFKKPALAIVALAAFSLSFGVTPVRAGLSGSLATVSANQAAEFRVPDRIWIDKLSVDAVIQPVGPGRNVGKKGVEWGAPNNKNVGWHDYSGRLGEGKNIVLNGHNNIYGAVFRKLYTLSAGDEMRLGAGDQVVTYRVETVTKVLERGQPLSVRLRNAQAIQPALDDRLTIVSCWPETSNTHRIIVIARPVR